MAEQRQALKAVKKKWFPVCASKEFDEKIIGESLVAGPSDLVGRIISVNLMTLTDDIKQQSVYLKFKVISADSEKATADLIAVELIPAAVRRLVRRGCNRIDVSYVCETADGRKARLKPFLVTKALGRGAVVAKLRKELMRYIASEVKKVSFEELVRMIISNRLQTSAKSSLKKIYPIRSCEIKWAGIVSKGKVAQQQAAKELPAEEKEETE